MPELSRPALPARAALLLDLDGTLIDFAPTPDAVVVPDGLRASLRALRSWLGDALAVVSGRPVAQIDALLGNLPFAVAGEHGGAIRHAPGAALERPDLPQVPAGWLADAEAAVAAWPGALVERKARGLVLHFRQAPAAAGALHDVARQLVGGDGRFEVLPGSMVWEIRPHGADKGSAVRALMARPPFAGRVPVYIGDDRTDEDGIRAARALGGVGWLVAEVFGDAAGVRAWLAAVAGDGEGG
jgi:trehalose 6-phosphate phosphatase